jgi:hypothetical protein
MAEVSLSVLTNAGCHIHRYIPLIWQERRMDVVEVLSFLFMLSTMDLGRVSTMVSNHGKADLKGKYPGVFDGEFESNATSHA